MTVHDLPATEAEVKKLKSEGYFVRERFFTGTELDRVEELADRAIAFHNQCLDGEPTTYSSVSVKDGIVFANQLADDSDAGAELLSFALQPRFASFARSVAGPDAAHHCWQIVYKFPHFTSPFPWHQDHTHTPADRPFYNIWIALSDMSAENGCLRVLPGVALDQVLQYHPTPFGMSCWPLDDPNQGIPMEMERGSVFVVTSHTLHMSGGNYTDGYRKALLLVLVDRNAVVHGRPVRSIPYDSTAPHDSKLVEASRG